jgi:hypothetical protein
MSFLTRILLSGETMKPFLERLAGGCCSFSGLGMGGNRSPEPVEGNAEGASIPRKQVAEKTSP